MKLSELIAKVGDENVKVQFLSDSLTHITSRKRGGNAVTFITSEMTPTDVIQPRIVGMVVWIPKAKWDVIAAECRTKPVEQPKEGVAV